MSDDAPRGNVDAEFEMLCKDAERKDMSVGLDVTGRRSSGSVAYRGLSKIKLYRKDKTVLADVPIRSTLREASELARAIVEKS